VTGWHELRAIARNAASSYGMRLLRGLSVLLITPYLFRKLGTGGFGTWAVMFTVATVINLLEYGVSAGVTKFVAQFHARGERRRLEDTVSGAIVVLGAVGVIAALIATAIGVFASGLAAPGERDAFETGMLVLAGATVLYFPTVAYGAALTGYQRYELFNACQAAIVVTFALGTVVAIESGAGIVGLSVAYGASLIFGGIGYVLLLRRVDPELSLQPHRPTREALRRVAGFGTFTLLADSMVFIGQRMDTIVIAAVRGAATAAPFAAAIRLAGAVQSLTFPFITLLMPMASDLHSRGRHAEVISRLTIATRVAIQLTFPTAVAFSIFATDIADIWVGPDAPDITADIIAVLMAVQVLTMSAFPAEKILVGIGRVKVVAMLAVIEGVSNIAISIALVSAYGAIGAAIGTLLTSGLLAPIKFPLVCRATGCPLSRLLRNAVVPAIVGTLPAVVAMLGVWALLPAGALRLFVGLALGLSVGIAVAALQIGPRRALATLRGMRANAVTGAPEVTGSTTA
jgi:O-antigen/teichoic acid export membrane protein